MISGALVGSLRARGRTRGHKAGESEKKTRMRVFRSAGREMISMHLPSLAAAGEHMVAEEQGSPIPLRVGTVLPER